MKILFFSIVFVCFTGCTSVYVQSNSDAHVQESEKLRLLMRELDLVVYDRFKSELERDDMRRRYAMILAETIKELSKKIEDKNNPKTFQKYSKQLYQNAQELYKIADRYELENLQTKIDAITRTCNSCHIQVRGY
ncbi:cytochrome c [bacterium]|nr:cytochrome c [bacterium]MBU1991212.1 cytochrome c [bacterium]